MTALFKRLAPQPLAGMSLACAAVVILAISSPETGFPAVATASESHILLPLCLVVALILAHQFPVRLREHATLYMGAVPLYLMATLLPTTEAAIAAALGTLVGVLAVRTQRRLYYGDVAAETGRWTLLVWTAAWSLHLAASAGIPRAQALLVIAAALWLGDIVTCPFVLGLISREPPLRIAAAYVREAGPVEAAQYLLGLLGSLVAVQQLWALALLVLPTGLVYVAFKSARDVDRGGRQVLESMADTVDLRAPWMSGHSRRVAQYTSTILKELGRSGSEAEMIVAAARIHDIGNIGIPDQLLRKSGRLSPEEQALVETHADRGAELLRRYPDFLAGAEMVLHHHERWDGTGYPDGLRALDIPFGARVIAVADSFDAMTSEQPHRVAMTETEAVALLREGRGTQWDATIVDAFLRAVEARVTNSTLPSLLVLADGAGSSASA